MVEDSLHTSNNIKRKRTSDIRLRGRPGLLSNLSIEVIIARMTLTGCMWRWRFSVSIVAKFQVVDIPRTMSRIILYASRTSSMAMPESETVDSFPYFVNGQSKVNNKKKC
jgi:hypothetical protein